MTDFVMECLWEKLIVKNSVTNNKEFYFNKKYDFPSLIPSQFLRDYVLSLNSVTNSCVFSSGRSISK
jgi:hypothetical protein